MIAFGFVFRIRMFFTGRGVYSHVLGLTKSFRDITLRIRKRTDLPCNKIDFISIYCIVYAFITYSPTILEVWYVFHVKIEVNSFFFRGKKLASKY